MTAAPCTATKRDGSPCAATAVTEGRCIGHRGGGSEARRRGGHQSSKAARAGKHLPEHLRAAQAVLIDLIAEVRTGQTTARCAEVIGGLVSKLIDLSKYADERGTAAELEQRLADLETRLAEGVRQ